MSKIKLKTHKGAQKRFKVTGTGKILIKGAGVRHILTKKTSKFKRQKRKRRLIAGPDARRIRSAMPYSF